MKETCLQLRLDHYSRDLHVCHSKSPTIARRARYSQQPMAVALVLEVYDDGVNLERATHAREPTGLRIA